VSTPGTHQLAREIRAAIFSGKAPAHEEFDCLVDTLTTYLQVLREFQGGPDGQLASLEFELSEELAKLFLAITSASRKPEA
jgi:hypothetical protein